MNKEPVYINLKINTENDLYHPFDTEKCLNDDVKNYIINKASEKMPFKELRLRIICPKPVSEEDVKAAFHRWFEATGRESKLVWRKNMIKMLLLFAFGIGVIALSVILQPKISTVLFTIITTVGTFSIWEGASIWIIQNPDLRIRKKSSEQIIRSSKIEFLYTEN